MDTYALDNALSLISQDVDAELQIQTLRCFLFVAHRGSCTQKEVETNLKISDSSASRNISYWTDLRFDKKPGKNFLMRIEDPQDRRYRILTLTKKGREFFESLRSPKHGA